jgi:hypothetical protein
MILSFKRSVCYAGLNYSKPCQHNIFLQGCRNSVLGIFSCSNFPLRSGNWSRSVENRHENDIWNIYILVGSWRVGLKFSSDAGGSFSWSQHIGISSLLTELRFLSRYKKLQIVGDAYLGYASIILDIPQKDVSLRERWSMPTAASRRHSPEGRRHRLCRRWPSA